MEEIGRDVAAKSPEGEELGRTKRQPDLVVNARPYGRYTIIVESYDLRTELEFYQGRLTGIKKTEIVSVPK